MSEKQIHRGFITPVIRASYVFVHEKTTFLNGTDGYSIQGLIPKTDKEGVKRFKQAITSAAAAFFGKNKAKWPKSWNGCLRDGDEETDKGKAYRGHYFFSAKNYSRKPQLVGPDGQPLVDPVNEFYSGCYCRLSLNFAGYNKAGNKGVGIYVNNIMKVKDGERLDGVTDAEDDFSAYFNSEETAEEESDFLENEHTPNPAEGEDVSSVGEDPF